MAGSYNHCVDKETGQLKSSEDLQSALECCSGDVYEAIEEMYGMIWFLATSLAGHHSEGLSVVKVSEELVEEARQRYQYGLHLSPGFQ